MAGLSSQDELTIPALGRNECGNDNLISGKTLWKQQNLDANVKGQNLETSSCYSNKILSEEAVQVLDPKKLDSKSVFPVVRSFKAFFDNTTGAKGNHNLVSEELTNRQDLRTVVQVNRQGVLVDPEFIALSKPGKPKVCDAEITHNMVKPQWTPPNRGSMSKYEVQCESKDSNSFQRVNISGDSCSLELGGLSPGEGYLIRVRGICEVGKGPFSDACECTTRPCEPPSTPNVAVLPNAGIKVSWKKPSRIGPNVILSKYTISIFSEEDNGENSQSVCVPPDSSSRTITLTSNLTYHLYITADCGKHGKSLPSQTIERIFIKPKPPGQPEVLENSVTHVSAVLCWQPTDIRNILEYEVQYNEKGMESNLSIEKAQCKDIKSFMLRCLHPGTKYEVKVWGVYEEGTTPFSSSCTLVTRPCDPPGIPVFESVEKNVANLFWKPPQNIGSNVCLEEYIIFSPQGDGSLHEIERVSADHCSANIRLDTEGRYHLCTVANCGIHGMSLPSHLSPELYFPVVPVMNVVNVTHNSIDLRWSKDRNVTNYAVSYKEKGSHEECHIDVASEVLSLSSLHPNTEYVFKVRGVYKDFRGSFSDAITERTKPCGPPGTPRIRQIALFALQISWDPPSNTGTFARVESYIVNIYCQEDEKLVVCDLDSEGRCSVTLELGLKRTYSVTVIATCGEYGRSTPSQASEEYYMSVKAKDLPKAQVYAKHREKSDQDSNRIIVLDKTPGPRIPESSLQKYELGKDQPGTKEKVLMIVGAIGSGKTTLINGLINYVYGIDWKDSFRLKLIDEGIRSQNQAQSQASWVTSYKINHQSGFRIPYTLTVIDTPGFGNTAGVKGDLEIAELITRFFTTQGVHGIVQLDAVGFVLQSSLSRLTPSQKFIFDQILGLFGKDIASNIFMLLTFADGARPQVLCALEVANIQYDSFFKFNNAVLYSPPNLDEDSEQGNFDEMFWKMGIISFRKLFKAISSVEPRSLLLTKEVLQQKEKLTGSCLLC